MKFSNGSIVALPGFVQYVAIYATRYVDVVLRLMDQDVDRIGSLFGADCHINSALLVNHRLPFISSSPPFQVGWLMLIRRPVMGGFVHTRPVTRTVDFMRVTISLFLASRHAATPVTQVLAQTDRPSLVTADLPFDLPSDTTKTRKATQSAVLAVAPLTTATTHERSPRLEPHAPARSSILLHRGLMLPVASGTWIDPRPVTPPEPSRAVRNGAIIGGAIGAAVGVAVVVVNPPQCKVDEIIPRPPTSADECIAQVVGIVIVGAVVGALVGAGIGATKADASGSEGQPNTLQDRLRLGIVPQFDGRFALGASFQF